MKAYGFSLLEALLALAVVATVSAIALPTFAEFVARQQATAAVNQLVGAIRTARHAAMTGRQNIALCAAEHASCLGRNQWHRGAMIFADHNADGARQLAEPVIATLLPLPDGARISWRSFRNRAYLLFRGSGMTDWQNGTFTYCPANNDLRVAKAVIINAQGRLAKSRDANADGVDEDARGRPLRC